MTATSSLVLKFLSGHFFGGASGVHERGSSGATAALQRQTSLIVDEFFGIA